jgi:glycosyltransferase involved in cell wall biosynthesis
LLNKGRVGTYLRYWLWIRKASRVAADLLRSEPFDVAHHLSWGSLPWGVPVDGRSVPAVIGPIGGGQQIPSAFLAEFSAVERAMQLARAVVVRLSRFNPLARAAAKRAKVSLATNSASGELLRCAGAGVVLPFLADVTPAEFIECPVPEFENRNDTVLWVGRLLPLKAPALAVQALAQMEPHTRLVFVGDGPERERLLRLASDLGVGSRVTFAGQLNWVDVRAVLDSSKVMLFTSLRDSSGPQLLEAGARGLPIVAVRHHGAGEWVPPCAGALVEPTAPADTVLALAGAVDQLIRDRRNWVSASEESHKFALDHSVERHAEQLVGIYKQSLETR